MFRNIFQLCTRVTYINKPLRTVPNCEGRKSLCVDPEYNTDYMGQAVALLLVWFFASLAYLINTVHIGSKYRPECQLDLSWTRFVRVLRIFHTCDGTTSHERFRNRYSTCSISWWLLERVVSNHVDTWKRFGKDMCFGAYVLTTCGALVLLTQRMFQELNLSNAWNTSNQRDIKVYMVRKNCTPVWKNASFVQTPKQESKSPASTSPPLVGLQSVQIPSLSVVLRPLSYVKKRRQHLLLGNEVSRNQHFYSLFRWIMEQSTQSTTGWWQKRSARIRKMRVERVSEPCETGLNRQIHILMKVTMQSRYRRNTSTQRCCYQFWKIVGVIPLYWQYFFQVLFTLRNREFPANFCSFPEAFRRDGILKVFRGQLLFTVKKLSISGK